eukprot:2234242-Rhodomonas_salina.3
MRCISPALRESRARVEIGAYQRLERLRPFERVHLEAAETFQHQTPHCRKKVSDLTCLRSSFVSSVKSLRRTAPGSGKRDVRIGHCRAMTNQETVGDLLGERRARILLEKACDPWLRLWCSRTA